MFQYMPLHWGQVKGASVFVVGAGTYRGRVRANRNCVATMEEPVFIIKIPADNPEKWEIEKCQL